MAQDVLSDGFVSLCIDPSLNFADGKCRILVEGQYTPSTALVTANKIVQVTNTRDLVALFGQGSILTESLRKVFCQCANNIEVYALPRLDDENAFRAVYALTVTGPATSDGRATLFMGDAAYNVDVRVRTGDTAAVIAAAIANAIPDDFPFTATVAAGVINFTAKNGGTVGNHLNITYNWAGRSNYAPTGVSMTFTQTVVGVTDPVPAANSYASIIGECCYSVYVLLSDNIDWQETLRDYIRSAWACDKPQCFGHGYVYNSGSLGQILATGDNSAEFSRLAVSPDDPIFPYLKIAAYASLSACTACTNPELSVQGPTFGLLSCVSQPTTCDANFSNDDIIALRAAGFVVAGPATVGSGTLTNPYIYNDVTNYLYDDLGRSNETFRDTSSRRLAVSTAISLATKLQEFNGLGLFTKNTTIKKGILGTTPRMMLASIRAWAKLNIGVLFSEFDDINSDIQLKTDFEVAPKCTGKPGKIHLNMRYRPPVRINEIVTNLQPALLDNCDR